MNERNLNTALELCYAGVTDPEALQSLTVRLCEDIGADAGDIVAEFTRSGAIVTYGSQGFDPGFLEAYDEEYLGRNPWFENLSRHSHDRFHTDSIEPAEIRQTRYYNEWVRPQGFGHTVGAVVEVGHAHHVWAGFCRRRGAPEFGEEADYLTCVLPHLRRALALRRALGEVEAEAARFASVVDALAAPLVLLDVHGKLRYANPAADRFLARCTALRVSRTGRLIAVSGRADASLGAAVGKAAGMHDDPTRPPPAPVVIPCRDGEAVAALVFPVEGGCSGITESRSVAVMLRQITATPDVEIDVRSFSKAHQLTRTEAELAAWVARGLSVADFADRHGMAVATARWHLRNLEQKTGTSRIEHLVSAVHAAQLPVR